MSRPGLMNADVLGPYLPPAAGEEVYLPLTFSAEDFAKGTMIEPVACPPAAEQTDEEGRSDEVVLAA